MSERTDTIGGPYRLTTLLKKWENGRTPTDGEPDEIMYNPTWYDIGGIEITDAERIAALEAAYPLPQGDAPCH